METMDRATQMQHRMLGMKMKHTTIMTKAPITMHWMEVGRTSSNCNKQNVPHGNQQVGLQNSCYFCGVAAKGDKSLGKKFCMFVR
jgi:hypothetical protein